jgi:transcriptional regulator with XRE-family HTH domain
LFGQLITSHRRRLCLTQEELAVAAGLSPRTVRELEAGVGRVPRPQSVRMLADAFGLRGANRDRFVEASGAVRRSGRGPAAAPPHPTVAEALDLLLDALARTSPEP